MTQTTTPQTDRTMSEVIDDMTGFDEIAVAKQFNGFNVYDAAGDEIAGPKNSDMVMLSRVAIFLVKRTEGLADAAAYQFAMELPGKRCLGFFPDEAEELDPDDPTSEPGKGADTAG